MINRNDVDALSSTYPEIETYLSCHHEVIMCWPLVCSSGAVRNCCILYLYGSHCDSKIERRFAVHSENSGWLR